MIATGQGMAHIDHKEVTCSYKKISYLYQNYKRYARAVWLEASLCSGLDFESLSHVSKSE